ncbi:MAG TPA: iron-siderophore ABC transporter substrate-binding protein [Capillimicrobium sp.]|jgi:iron complex transport system substrate-binding protein
MRLAAAVAVVLSSAAVAACGSDDGDNGTTAAQTGTQAAASGSFPVTIEHKFGSTEIPEDPERIVTVGFSEQDHVLALGERPVATREFLGGYDWPNRPWAQEALGGEEIEVIGGDEINFEAVAAQRPDLILALNAGLVDDDYERLSKIAPTIAQSGEYVDFGMPWEEQTAVIGKAIGREEEAQEVIADVQAAFEQAREEHPEFEGATSIMAYGGPDGYGAYTTEDLRSRILSDLGFELPEKIDQLAGDSFYVDLSSEQFRLLDADAVLMYGPQDDIASDPVFSRLDAVKEDRVIYIDIPDDFAGAIGFASPLSLPWALERAVPELATALDGDPQTKIQQPE